MPMWLHSTTARADGCNGSFISAHVGYTQGMKTCRVHIMGAFDAGVTTLGRALADALAFPVSETRS